MQLEVNGQTHTIDAPPDMPLLWVLRDVLRMTGTKFGCGMALCGACTVHVDGQPLRSCITQVSAVAGKPITTIEGVASDDVGKRVQAAWLELGVPQCGYCQAGTDHVRDGAAQAEPAAPGCGHRSGDGRQHLPLRHLYADSRRHQAGRRCDGRCAMSRMDDSPLEVINVSRRAFLGTTSAVGLALAVGLPRSSAPRRTSRSTAPTRCRTAGWTTRSSSSPSVRTAP